MEYLIALLLLGLLVFIAVKNEGRINSILIIIVLFVKILAGICVGLIYEYFYDGGDTYRMFEQLAVFDNDFQSYFISYLTDTGLTEPRVKVFLALISPLYKLSLGNYWLTSLYLSCIVVLPWIFIYKLVSKHYKTYSMLVLVLIMYPSILFWGSGLLKETLLLASIYFGAYLIIYIKHKQQLRLIHLLILMLIAYFLWQVKYYYFLPLMLLGVAFICWAHNVSNAFLTRHIRVVTYAGVTIFSFILIIFLPLVHENLALSNILEAIIRNNEIMKRNSSDYGIVEYHMSEGFLSLVLHFPKALFSAYFVPLFRFDSLLTTFASIEHCLLLSISIYTFYAVVKQKIKLRSYHYFLLCYLLTVPGLIALATPNMGTLNRYAMGYLPLYICFIGSLLIELSNKIAIDKK